MAPTHSRFIAIVLIHSFIVMGCSSISTFNQRAYEYATSSKAEALALMSKATEPFPKHRKDVESLRLNLEKAYEYARGLPKNEITTEQWAIMKNPGGHLLRFSETMGREINFVKGFCEFGKGIDR